MTTRIYLVPAALITLFGSSAFAQEAAPLPAPTPPAEQAPAASSPDAVVSDGEPVVSPPPEAAASTPEAAPPAPPPAPLAPAPPGRAKQWFSEPNGDAPAETEASEPDDGVLGTHQTHFTFQLGVRTSFVSDQGFDLFSDDDVFQGLSMSAGRVLVAEGPLSFAALVGADFSGGRGTARGAKAELFQHRYWLGGEARYHFLNRLYAFVRLAPALLNTQATLSDPIAQVEREAGGWGFGADGSAGAAIELLGKATGRSSTARGWVVVDGGYSWATSEDLTFSVSEDDSAPTRTASLDLGDLALRGGFFRVGVAVTF